MTEHNQVYSPEPIIYNAPPPPPPPKPTDEIEREADLAIAYLERFASSPKLDADLRVAFNDVKNTIKTLKGVVVRQSAEAKENHEKMVEILKSNTPNRRRD